LDPSPEDATVAMMKAQASKGPWRMILAGLVLAVLSSAASFPLGVFAGIGLLWLGASLHSFRSRPF
jgi:ABC-type phosphate transport system permease subunit